MCCPFLVDQTHPQPADWRPEESWRDREQHYTLQDFCNSCSSSCALTSVLGGETLSSSSEDANWDSEEFRAQVSWQGKSQLTDLPESINQLLIAGRFGHIGLRHAAAYKTEKVQWISVSVCQCVSESVCQWISYLPIVNNVAMSLYNIILMKHPEWTTLVRVECLAKCIIIQTVHWLVITLIPVQLSSCPLVTSTNYVNRQFYASNNMGHINKACDTHLPSVTALTAFSSQGYAK